MIQYKDIPHEIKESKDIMALRKKVPFWTARKMLSAYMDSFMNGARRYDAVGDQAHGCELDCLLTNITTYFVIKKEFLKRMSPLVSRRSKETICMDNKKLLEKFDECLMSGVQNAKNPTQKCILEICRRME